MSETPEVRELRKQIREQVSGEIHGVQVMEHLESDAYLLVHRTTTADKIADAPDGSFQVVDRRTVAVDMETGDITVTDNGLWTLPDAGILEEEKRQICRSITDTTDPNDWPPVEGCGKARDTSALDALVPVKPQGSTGQNTDRLKADPGIDDNRAWGYGGDPPPEVEQVTDRLENLGLSPDDHLIRLLWGQKEPFDKPRESVPVEELRGNYGIEVNRQNVGLVAIDVDYPDEFDADLPETFAVSSPHGSDQQAHYLFYCEDKEQIAEALGGAWASQVPDWGELWVGRRYIVGPGCELSEYGCNEGDHETGEAGGCPRCTTPGEGKYQIVNDREIATVKAETIVSELIDPETENVTVTADSDPFDRAANNDLEGIDPESHKARLLTTDDYVRCKKCGEVIKRTDAFTTTRGDNEITICRGGC